MAVWQRPRRGRLGDVCIQGDKERGKRSDILGRVNIDSLTPVCRGRDKGTGDGGEEVTQAALSPRKHKKKRGRCGRESDFHVAALSDGRSANMGARLGTEGVNQATGRAEIDFARGGSGARVTGVFGATVTRFE